MLWPSECPTAPYGMEAMKSTNHFAPVCVYVKRPDKPRATLVATFLTYYRARKFVLGKLSEHPAAAQFEWIIGKNLPE